MKDRILIADDEPGIQTLYERELTREGFEVLVASSGQEAIEKVQKESPDLVIIDVRMPGMNGLHAMSRILEEHNELPIIISSAYTSFQDSFMSWPADAYVVKSSDLTELKGTVRRVLEQRRVSS